MVIPIQVYIDVMCFLQESERGVSYLQIADQFRNQVPQLAVCAAVSLESLGYAEAVERAPFEGKMVPSVIRGRDAGLSLLLGGRWFGHREFQNDYQDWTEDQIKEFAQSVINSSAQ